MVTVNRGLAVAEWRRSRSALQSASVLSRAELSADAISRAYYAIRHAAKAALLTRSITASSHHAINRLLNRHLIYAGFVEREWLDVFRAAMRARMEADYDVMAAFTPWQAEGHRRQAAAFCARIRRYLQAEGFDDGELNGDDGP